MSYQFYNILHVVGVIVLFSALGVLAASAGSTSSALRKAASVAHGVAVVVILVAGFGLLARLGFFGDIPTWAYLKMGLWAVLAAIIVPLKRKPEWAVGLWVAMPVIGALAAWLAIAKPF
jgi:hypothetical protein